MRFETAEIAEAVAGVLHGKSVAVEGCSIDSRTVVSGQLFVPIVADRDGHQFIEAALAAGAAAFLTSQPPASEPSIEVGDTTQALAALAIAARRRLPDNVIGVTGSVGKTTTKDMLTAVLDRRSSVAASERSFNNELGVPLTLINAPANVDTVVIEMGARGLGHIRHLCDIASPTTGVVTWIAMAHTELLGDIETVSAAKRELIEALPDSGTAVLNADDALVSAMATRTNASVVTFGRSADVAYEVLSMAPDLRPRVRLSTPWGRAEVLVGARGRHQASNAAAAAATALVTGASLDDVVVGLAEDATSPWRMELGSSPSGAIIINDAYNANRTSTEAALRALAELPAPRKTAVLGLMAELGTTSQAEHRAVAALAESLGIRLIAVATTEYGIDPVESIGAARGQLVDADERDAILVKGSRVNGLERLAQALLAGE